MRKNKKKAPRRVSFEENEQDFNVACMVILGYSTACISAITGLTPGQVDYRVGRAGLQWQRYNYRNGTSSQAQAQLSELLHLDRQSAEELVMVSAETLDAPSGKGKKRKPSRRILS